MPDSRTQKRERRCCFCDPASKKGAIDDWLVNGSRGQEGSRREGELGPTGYQIEAFHWFQSGERRLACLLACSLARPWLLSSHPLCEAQQRQTGAVSRAIRAAAPGATGPRALRWVPRPFSALGGVSSGPPTPWGRIMDSRLPLRVVGVRGEVGGAEDERGQQELRWSCGRRWRR